MMRIMEEQGHSSAPLAKSTKSGNDGGIGPFVHDDQIRILCHLLRVETGGVIAAGGKLRIGIAESRQPSLDVVSHQIGKAAAIHRLHGTRLMPPGLQPAQQRSEEHTSKLQALMRISLAVFSLKKTTTHNCTQQH